LYRKACIGLCFILAFGMAGCRSSNAENQKISAQNTPGSEKAPDQLKTIEEGIEKIFKALEGPVGMTLEDKSSKTGSKDDKEDQSKGSSPKPTDKAQEENKKGQGSTEEGGNGTSKKSETSDSSKSGGEGGGQQQQQPAQKDPWQEVTKSIQELHTSWDEYAPKSIKNGATKDLTDQFSNALNNLTMVAMKKNNLDTMVAANQLYGHIPDFYYLYKSQVSPEVKKVKFYARDCVLSAMKQNWPQADTDIKDLKASFTVFKRSLEDNMKDKGTKIENSIYELEKVEKEKNKELTDIKGRLVLKGTMALEKEMESSSGKK